MPADCEKFFNILQLAEVDALQQDRGAVRRLHHAMLSNMHVQLSTRSGLTPPLPVARGVPQGAVLSPEVSRASQDPLLRLRAPDRVAAGYVDDIEHYGLETGSQVSGIGFAWSKFSAFAQTGTSASPSCPLIRGVSAEGAQVRSWDIWLGGVRSFFLPSPAATDVDKLLGKRGTPLLSTATPKHEKTSSANSPLSDPPL